MREDSPSADTWRRPVQDHFVLLTYPFRLAKELRIPLDADIHIHDRNVARQASAALDSGAWSHWLEHQLEDPDDPVELDELLNDAYFFRNPFRGFIFPELDSSQTPGKVGPETIADAIARVHARIEKVRSGSLGGNSLRLRAVGSKGPVNLMLSGEASPLGKIAYQVQVSYVDICLFPNERAVMVVCISNITRSEGKKPLDTAELGWVVRKLKRMRNRYLDDTPVPEWSQFLDPYFTSWGKSLSQLTATRASSSFRAITFCSIFLDERLHVATPTGLFRTARERLYYELATGHDTTNPRELPASGQAVEFASEATVNQWNYFDASVYWGDITVLAEELATRLRKHRRSKSARDSTPPGLPAQARSSFLWLMILASYEAMTSRDYLKGLTSISAPDKDDAGLLGSAVTDYAQYIGRFSHLPVTESRLGTAIYLALVRMLNLTEVREAVSSRLRVLQAQIEAEASESKIQAETKTQQTLAVLGIGIGVVAIVISILGGKISKLEALDNLTPEQASYFLLVALCILGYTLWWVWSRRRRPAKSANRARNSPTPSE